MLCASCVQALLTVWTTWTTGTVRLDVGAGIDTSLIGNEAGLLNPL
jgi:hypothetical protein